MKPHEETWTLNDDETEIRCGTSGHELYLMRRAGVAQRPEIARLARAAPEMARALLHVLACRNPSGNCPSCGRAMRAALANAGVVP